MSPAYRTDGTALCAGIEYGDPHRVRLYVTTDHARTWTERPASGIVVGDEAGVHELAISPAYQDDGVVVVQLFHTVYVSTDGGMSFARLPLFGGRVTVDAAGVTEADTRGVVLGASGLNIAGTAYNYLFDPVVPGVRVIAGSGTGRDVAFLVQPGTEAGRSVFVVAESGQVPTTRHTVYACDAGYACTTKLGSFPPGEDFDQVWFAADFATSRTLFATTYDLKRRGRVYVSRDGGRTFTRDAVLDRAIAAGLTTGKVPVVVLAPGRAGSATVFARVSVGTDRRDPPSQQLFRSDDNGRKWRLIAYGRSPYAPGPKGTMPYSPTYSGGSARSTPTGLLTYAPDGSLLFTGRNGTAFAVWCSRDGGRKWRVDCP